MFQVLSETFNTDNEIISATDNITKEITTFEQKKNEVVAKAKKELKLEDKEYLQAEIKNIIDNGKKVLETLQGEIKIGSSPRMFEVYAQLLSSVISGLKELRDLNKVIMDINMLNLNEEPINQPKASLNVNMTAKELMEMIKLAKKDNQLNAISADFKIDENIEKVEKNLT